MACKIEYAEVTEEEQLAFRLALKVARQAVTHQKNTIEGEWFDVPGGTRVKEEQWFVRHYKTAGALIGPHRRLAAILRTLEGYVVTGAGPTWSVSTASEPSKPICTVSLYVGDPDDRREEEDCLRPIYTIRKRDYVLDDDGIPTRRYAFCVRPEFDGAPKLKPPGALDWLGWRFSNSDSEWGAAMQQALDVVLGDRSTWWTLDIKVKVCLAYLNYANQGFVGVCLSSTPKRVRDNIGKAFVDKENYSIWRVDLAKIPVEHVLINIYAREPRLEGWTAGHLTNGKTKEGEWISQGTVKNRELFCSLVPKTAATSTLTGSELLKEGNWSWKSEEFSKV